MDWLGQMLNLPAEFLYSSGGKGGGVIQYTADDSVLVAIIAARDRAIREHPHLTPGHTLDKLVAYTSQEAHSCIKKAAQLALVRIRSLPGDENFALRGATLAAAIEEDKSKGLIPCFLGASVGTTSTVAIDNLCELGPICEREKMWMHIDGAYAGSAAICPEFRHLINGVEYSMSFCINPHKWLHVNKSCSALWVKDRELVTKSFSVEPEYLKNHHLQGDVKMPDYRNMTVQLSRPFTSLKVWFVLRMYGVQGLQERIRKDVALAKEFEALVRQDDRFEIIAEVNLGVVCFKLKGNNDLNEALVKRINGDRRIYLTPSTSKGVFFLRFVVAVYNTESKDVMYAWNIIQEQADSLLMSHVNGTE
ncbi:aromatic-L-amino-acid decarboxylase [Elysia marginata]|uniref:Aromatic-L-amino-acid decarboxylase n=1 Tax=Elysia marginata TaxID=1093978 RepID=A0AAV4J1C9_9GAST|nr:aromatic-L-amino-acid decarboxylase [Elysia marginata]